MRAVSRSNWAGNVTYSAERVLAPASVGELQDVVAAAETVHAHGSGHSFNDVADTTGVSIDTTALPFAVEVDERRRVARVPGGASYGDVAAELHRTGWALGNLASLPQISIAGSVATGTHGSGDRNPGLAGAVSRVEAVTASGELMSAARGDATFGGMAVNVGALGVVTHLELDIEPTFEVDQTVFVDLPWDATADHLSEVTALGYSVSLFTRFTQTDAFDQLWVKRRTDRDAELPDSVFGSVRQAVQRHPIPGASTENSTAQGVAGPWHERLPHFRPGFKPSAGDEIQSEFLVPREHAAIALAALRGLAHRIAPLLWACEIRSVAGDDQWLSPSPTDALCIHFTWRLLPAEVRDLVPAIEELLLPLGARPHWGKVFTATSADLAPLYPHWHEFRSLARRLDPQRKFGNGFLERVLDL